MAFSAEGWLRAWSVRPTPKSWSPAGRGTRPMHIAARLAAHRLCSTAMATFSARSLASRPQWSSTRRDRFKRTATIPTGWPRRRSQRARTTSISPTTAPLSPASPRSMQAPRRQASRSSQARAACRQSRRRRLTSSCRGWRASLWSAPPSCREIARRADCPSCRLSSDRRAGRCGCGAAADGARRGHGPISGVSRWRPMARHCSTIGWQAASGRPISCFFPAATTRARCNFTPGSN